MELVAVSVTFTVARRNPGEGEFPLLDLDVQAIREGIEAAMGSELEGFVEVGSIAFGAIGEIAALEEGTVIALTEEAEREVLNTVLRQQIDNALGRDEELQQAIQGGGALPTSCGDDTYPF